MTGAEDDGKCRFEEPELFDGVDAIKTGHHHINNGELDLRVMAPHEFDAMLAVKRGVGQISLSVEYLAGGAVDERVVVDDEDVSVVFWYRRDVLVGVLVGDNGEHEPDVGATVWRAVDGDSTPMAVDCGGREGEPDVRGVGVREEEGLAGPRDTRETDASAVVGDGDDDLLGELVLFQPA